MEKMENSLNTNFENDCIIPNHLKLDDIGFVLITSKNKTPFEKDWQNNPYSYNDTKLMNHISKGGNYGVVGGYGNIRMLDCDKPELYEAVKDKLDSFTVKTGSGGYHVYFFCTYENNHVLLDGMGELRAKNYQCVAPGSTHPNGNKYKIERDVPIKEIQEKVLLEILQPYLRSTQEKTNSSYNTNQDKDQSRSALEYRRAVAEFRKGKSRSEVETLMMAYKKFADAPEGYRQKTLDKAEDYALSQIEKANTVLSQPGTRTAKAIQVFVDKRSLAEQFIKIQPMFYDAAKNFWIWNFNDYCWKIVDEVDILNLIEFHSTANTIESKQKQEILESLRQEGRKNTPKHIEKTWIQFKNMFVDIKNKNVIRATPQYFATNPIPHSIGETKETPTIDKLFQDWVGEKYVVTLKEIAAYCMLPDYPIHRIFCFLGGGRNGKSRYLAFINLLLGSENVSAAELDNLMNSRFELFCLYKKLAVQMGETNFSTMRRTAILKALSGQDKVNFEQKNKNPISDFNYAKLLISTNNLPETEDRSDGFYRRWLTVQFPNQFPEGKDILESIPKIEYDNFCAQIIDILNELMERGSFTNEGTVEERKERYEACSNPLDRFIKEFCIRDEDSHVYKYEFKKNFEDWCKDNNYRIMSDLQIKTNLLKQNMFDERVTKDIYDAQLFKYVTKRVWAWHGIFWKDSGVNKSFANHVMESKKAPDKIDITEEII